LWAAGRELNAQDKKRCVLEEPKEEEEKKNVEIGTCAKESVCVERGCGQCGEVNCLKFKVNKREVW
jgi:hypothetical protein